MERRDGSIPSATVSGRQRRKETTFQGPPAASATLSRRLSRKGSRRRPGKRSRHDGGENLSGIFEEMEDRDGDEILQAVLRIRRDEGAWRLFRLCDGIHKLSVIAAYIPSAQQVRRHRASGGIHLWGNHAEAETCKEIQDRRKGRIRPCQAESFHDECVEATRTCFRKLHTAEAKAWAPKKQEYSLIRWESINYTCWTKSVIVK